MVRLQPAVLQQDACSRAPGTVRSTLASAAAHRPFPDWPSNLPCPRPPPAGMAGTMALGGVQPSPVTYSATIMACARLGDWQRAVALKDDMLSRWGGRGGGRGRQGWERGG